MKKVEISVFDIAYLTILFENSSNCLFLVSAFIVSKNINKLHDHLQNVEKLGQPSEEFVKFAAEIRAAQDANDTEAVKEMETRNASLIAERKNQIEDVQKLLKESAEPIKLNSLPKDLIPNEVTARQINNLEKIII